MSEFFNFSCGGNGGSKGEPKKEPSSEEQQKAETVGSSLHKALESIMGAKPGETPEFIKHIQNELFDALGADPKRSHGHLLAALKTVTEHLVALSNPKCMKCIRKKGHCSTLHNLGNAQDAAGFLYMKLEEVKLRQLRKAVKLGKVNISEAEIISIDEGHVGLRGIDVSSIELTEEDFDEDLE
jgi:hypothetical protein